VGCFALLSGDSVLPRWQFINNSAMENQTISNADFKNLASRCSLKNVTFVNCSFTKVRFWNRELKNVTFKNCNFFEISFENITFDNVAFTGGKIEMIKDRYNSGQMFETIAFYNIKNRNLFLLDGVSLHYGRFLGIEGGSLILRNMSDFNFDPGYNTLLNGDNLTLGIENCVLAGIETIARLGPGSNIYIKDSYLLSGEIISLNGRDDEPANFYAENSYLASAFAADYMGSLVLRNCVLGTDLSARNIFLTAPRVTTDSYIDVSARNVYIWGNNTALDFIKVSSSRLDIYDLNLTTLRVAGRIKALNLRNVKLDNLWFDDSPELQGGNWENVEIMSPLRVNSPGRYHFNPINIHNTILHSGSGIEDRRESSANGMFKLEMRESAEPLQWDETTAPDLRQLGINLQ
jgi:uncharacterized protein YjbI with pentapeptide repeats